jgi:hypothetical protein
MIFNDHSKLEGQHAFLGASKYHWLRWDDETLEERYYGQFTQMIGTELHVLAKDLISNRIKLAKHDKKIIDITLGRLMIPKGSYDSEEILLTLLPFVNDAIGFRMVPEVILFYSIHCFGTADAITFNETDRILRINDFKSGITPVKMDQLMIYAALFCLEYKKNPYDFVTELRIYQTGEIILYIPEPTEIEAVMGLITSKNKIITKYLEREYRR